MERTLKAHWLHWGFLLALTLVLLSGTHAPAAADGLRLVIDGQLVMSDPPPVLRQGRTLVPVRLVAEALGAEVKWIEEQGAVHIVKADRSVLMRIGSHLVESDTGVKAYGLSDVAPILIGGRTYVPLRLVGNALGVAVRWDESTRTVYLDSSQGAVVTSFFNLKITSVRPGEVVTSKVDLKVTINQALPAGAKEIRYLLLSPTTGRGVVIARGTNLTATYNWLPDMQTNGQKVLVAAVYDAQGRFLAGDAMPMDVALTPRVSLRGLTPGQVVQGSVALSPDVNFSAAYVTYEIIGLTTGRAFVSPKSDPLGTYTWTPMLEDNGAVSFRVTAYSATGVEYPGEAVTITVNALRRLELRGLNAGATVEKPVNLSVHRNFQITAVEYVLRDPITGNEQSLAWVQTADHRFFPNPAQAGKRELFARVTDTDGITHTAPAVAVNISGKALLLLSGVGPPGQVITGPLNLTTTSNVPLEGVRYMLTNRASGARTEIGDGLPGAQFSWIPTQAGDWSIQAAGRSAGGSTLISETISFRVYLG
ncbi:MAG: copper amine oxidase N-terminal domain-containing protein, partial [Bacillota bacterium]|nr:copper amine oxidase N-terminal domain-containing protein [Bacillota bacterium]